MKNYPGPAEYLPSEKLYQSDKGKYTMTSRPKGKGSEYISHLSWLLLIMNIHF